MFTKFKNKMLAASVAGTALISGAALADDTPPELGDIATSAAASIEGVGAHLITVGSAIIGLAAVALAIRWVKATFF